MTENPYEAPQTVERQSERPDLPMAEIPTKNIVPAMIGMSVLLGMTFLVIIVVHAGFSSLWLGLGLAAPLIMLGGYLAMKIHGKTEE